MAKYKIIPSSRTIVHSPIPIGHKAEKGVEAIEFDLTAWVETYGSGTLTVIMRRWGDAIPYPITLEIDENNKATWTLSDTDTAKAGMTYAQLNYIVGDEVVKKSDIYTFRVMDSLTGEGEPPEAYDSWLEHLTHLAAEAMAEVLDIEGIVTDKTLTVSGAPADSAETGRQFGLIKDDLGAEINSVYEGISIDDNMFEKGSIGNSGGNDTYRQACRCRLIDKHVYNVDVDFEIIATNTLVDVVYYDDAGTMTDSVQKTSGSYTIPAKSLFRLFIDGRRGQSAEEMTISEILERVEFSVDSPGLNAIDASVKQLRTDVDNVQSQLGNVIPDYYFTNDYLPNKAHTAQLNANASDVSFGFVTDMHMGDSSKLSMLLAKYIADRTSALPFVICGGDIPETNTGTLDGLYEQAQDWQKMMGQFGAHNVYTCRGNHDYLAMLTEGSTALTSRACHAYVMGYRPYNIHPSAEGKNSYYFDIDTAKIRFIVLDQYDVSNTDMDANFTAYIGLSPQQYHWFAEKALNADGYDIVIICHQPLNIVGDTTYKSNLDLLRDIITAFNAHDQFSGSWGHTTINVDFGTYTSNLICVLSGHKHYDADGNTGFLNIVTTSDAIYQTDGYNRQLGTITECAFDIVSINTTSKVIKCTRIGSGSDRDFSY